MRPRSDDTRPALYYNAIASKSVCHFVSENRQQKPQEYVSSQRLMKEMLNERLHWITEAGGTEGSPWHEVMASAPYYPQGEICCFRPVSQYCVTWWKQKKLWYLEEKKNTFPYIFPHIFRWPFFPAEPTLSAWLGGYEGCLLLNDNGTSRIAPWMSCIIKKCQLCLSVYIPRPCDRLSTETRHARSQTCYEMTRKRRLRNKILWIINLYIIIIINNINGHVLFSWWPCRKAVYFPVLIWCVFGRIICNLILL